jgi:exodeoxyribonuclease VII large subunit
VSREPAPGPPAPRVLRVGELVAELRAWIRQTVGAVWVVGEISNFRRVASGHCYFTLKDDDAQLRAVLFRGQAEHIAFEPEDGIEVLVFGEVGIYDARGDLQLVVRQLEPRGRGALQLAFEQLRARLEREGLFDPGRKRPIPEHPRCVGVLTSLHGAALRDVIEVSGARLASVPLLVAPARVQGEGAESEILEALQILAGRPEVDVILLVRGGGALEDLWPFNTEILARAIARCPIPVVTGIGHETDVTIADLVADWRAPTPSAAAARALPDGAALRLRIGRDLRRLVAAARTRLERARARLESRRDQLRHVSPGARLAVRAEGVARLSGRMRAALDLRLARARGRLGAAAAALDSLSPLAVLGRGYAIARRAADGRIVRDPAEVRPGDRLRVRVARGEIAARVADDEPASS